MNQLFIKLRVGICVANLVAVFVSSRSTAGRTLYDPYSPYSVPNMMLKLTQRNKGHFVTLFDVGKHLIVGIFLGDLASGFTRMML